ncbi:hypothetical protein EJ08DRAFT_657904 [Tothia fuscella]|uniref:Uncharacterized protein n=1 Tax=Tothia fuscella TaxID=1048955 RepID=A0A9P4U0N5_9PEZI|nr:hypothetical protein EJ08DRAFT_657904 [Tothia fuscella]
MRSLLLSFLLPVAIVAQSRGEPVAPNNGMAGMGAIMVKGGVNGGPMQGMPVVPGMAPQQPKGPYMAPEMTGPGARGGVNMDGGGPIMEKLKLKKRTTRPSKLFPGIQRLRVVDGDNGI